MAEITVVGSFVMDMTAYVDKFAMDGETLIANRVKLAVGGKGVNQAVAAKRLGHSVEMIGMLGDDDYGKEFLKVLREDGIEHKNVFVSKTLPTGMAQIQIDRTCQNRIVVIPGANTGFGLAEVELIDHSLRNTKIVMVQFELDIEVTREILKRAKAYGATTILNPAPARCVDMEILRYADYITPNDVELGALAGMTIGSVEDAMMAANALHAKGVKNVICTLGGSGALVVNDELKTVVPIFPVKVVDTVGAGDSFNGAFAVKLLENAGLIDAIVFANAEGALTVTREGAIPALHHREEVEAFLNTQLQADRRNLT